MKLTVYVFIFYFFLRMKPRETKARRDTYYLHINLVLAICFSQICFVIGTFIVTVDVVCLTFGIPF